MKRITLEGKCYSSISEAARAYRIDPQVVFSRMSRGWPTREAFGLKIPIRNNKYKKQKRPIAVKGRQFSSVSSACEHFGISISRYYGRLQAGWPVDKIFSKVTRSPRATSVAGLKFRSLTSASEYFNLDSTLVSYRLKNGWSVNQAFGLALPPTKSLDRAAIDRSEQIGYIYLITNRMNGKKYVGLTAVSPKSRFAGHVSSVSRKTHPLGLSAAIAEFGPASFSLKILKKAPLSHLAAMERRFIMSHQSLAPSGYNLSAGGQLGSYLGTECSLKGVRYPSMSSLARAYGLHPDRVKTRLSQGWTLEEAVELVKRRIYRRVKVTTVGRKTFANLREAADYFGVRYELARTRKQDGWSLEEIFELKVRRGLQKRRRTFELEGTIYPTITACAKAYGKNTSAVGERLRRGWTLPEALGINRRPRFKNRPNPITVGSMTFESKAAACAAHGLPYGRVNARLEAGWTIDEAFELRPRQ